MSAALPALREALHVLYCSPDAAARRDADAFLQRFAHRDDAWAASHQLLLLGDPGEQLYAARTLHVLLRCSVAKAEKRQKSHVSMSDEERGGFRDALAAAALRAAAAGPPGAAVLTQLALALAALLIKWDALPPASVLEHAVSALGTGADVAASRGAQLALLRLLPEEVCCRELSVHPARRAAVADALRSSAPALLSSLPSAAAAGAPEALPAALDAAASWSEFAAGAPGVAAAVATSPLTSHAFAVLAAGGPDAALQPALGAASAAASALLAECAGAAALLPLLRSLRAVVAAAPASSPPGAAAAALLAHAAAEAAPRAARGDDAAATVLAEAADAMLDAVAAAPGPLPDPPLTWLAPWSAARDAVTTPDAAPGGAALIAAVMTPLAERLAALAPARAALPADAAPFPGEDDDGSMRAEIADALRDAVALAGAAAMLRPLAASLAACAAAQQQQPWRCGEAAAFCAAVVVRALPADVPSNDAEALCAAAVSALPPAPAPHPRAAAAAAALLGAMGAWLGRGARDDVAAAACAALERGVACADAAIARPAAIALMRAVDAGAAARFAAGGAVPRLAALLAAGGPREPPRGTLRVGQEPASTVLLRAAATMACHVSMAPAALAALLPAPMRAAEAALADVAARGGAHALAADDVALACLAEALRDVAVVVDAAARCGAAAQVVPPACAVLAPAAVGAAAHEHSAVELCGLLWSVAAAVPAHRADAAAAAAAAYARGGQAPFLGLLTRLVTSAAADAQQQPTASPFPEALARAANDAAAVACGDGGGDAARCAGAPLLRLIAACASDDGAPLASPGALHAAAAAVASCLRLTAGDDARAACASAAALLSSRALLTSPDGDALASGLAHALLCAANGALPPDAVSAAAGALHAGWRAAGDVRAAAWLRAALADPTLPRHNTPPAAKADFVAALLEPSNAADERRFKRVLKNFCGGKKKGYAAADEARSSG